MSRESAFQGQLGLLSLFDLGQLLLLNGATGVLAIEREGRKAYLYFDHGQIVNAVDDELHEGEGAAYRLFAWRTGSFVFTAQAPSGARAIAEGTEGLMLEAARRIDEQGGAPGEPSMSQQLQARADAFDALREAFQVVARDVRHVGATPSSDAPFEALRESCDALLYRPGRTPRLLQGGQWMALGDEPLQPAEWVRMCGRFFDRALPENEIVRAELVEDGRHLEVTRFPGPNDALIVRATSVAAPAAARLEGPALALDALLDLPVGLVLVGGPTVHAADQLLHAMLERLLERRAVTVVSATEGERWRHAEGRGARIPAPPRLLVETLAAASPDVVVLDVMRADESLEALHRASLVVCAVVAPDAGSLLTRWLSRLGLGVENLARLPLAGGGLGVVYTALARHPEGRIPFLAARLALDELLAAAARAPGPAPVPDSRPGAASVMDLKHRTKKPVRPGAEPEADPDPAPRPPTSDEMPRDALQALAQELRRQLREAA